MNFVETTITIRGQNAVGEDATKTYPGKVLEGSGLGYWIATFDGEEPDFYAPTHIPSGHRITTEPFFSEEIVQQYITSAAALFSWNKPVEQLIATPGYWEAMQQMSQLYARCIFEDAAATAMGGRV
jgi:hypothetical protein